MKLTTKELLDALEFKTYGGERTFVVERQPWGSFVFTPAAPVMAFWIVLTLLWLVEDTTLIVVSRS